MSISPVPESRPEAQRGELLQLVPFFLGGQQGELLPALQASISRQLAVGMAVHPPGFDPELAFDDSRGQYNSRMLLALLLRDLRPGCTRILGVTGVDLFIPVLTFVFGEAQLEGRAAVVSIHRLSNEPYGLPPNPPLLAQRLVKEALHELGHNFGLLHCHGARCVMASSTYVEEIDFKPDRFCDACRSRLGTSLRVPTTV